MAQPGHQDDPSRRYNIWLPGLTVVGRLSGEYSLIQRAVPIDGETTRRFNINCWRRIGRRREFYDRAEYYLFRSRAHDRLFSDQDKLLSKSAIPDQGQTSTTGVGVIAWRKFAGTHGRRPPEEPTLKREVA